ncbi:phosphate signaling complex protein PhoU [Metallumcola ferriviriculae]|uniref:Phosphate-specific transport system accessory protein PhoU n=1 Tax=Metallumcola ferriviriculae TaxID=3039180 RepID=A0AAU0URN2_9FIRM|nr:phosphate signaling complex protein PhoU [Desulfitibacteraceae bacterium MK1]
MISRPLNAYERAIKSLEAEILNMGEDVNEILMLSMEGLINQDEDMCNRVIEMDDPIDDMDYDIEQKALEIISLQQPIEKDLRTLASAMRIIKELERIADYAVNIAQVSLRLRKKGQYFKPLVDIPRMADLALAMVNKSLKAYTQRDVRSARELDDDDTQVDKLFEYLYDELIDFMKNDCSLVDQASYLSLVARYLERVGDHAVNIAEMTIYMVTGERRPFDRVNE